jgi:uncharacterized membrane protein
MSIKPHLSHARHVAKAITYRVVGTMATIVIGWTLTGSIQIGASLGLCDMIVKTVLYYLHERIWYNIPFGVVRPTDPCETRSKTVH